MAQTDKPLQITRAKHLTQVRLYDEYDVLPGNSKAEGGSVFFGVKLLKSGDFGGKRTWEALLGNSHLALIGTTEKVPGGKGKWKGVSFSGKEYLEKSRNALCEQMVSEFLSALNQGEG